ncbi:hypothetical protein C1646_759825 [Rhizophagus diaphanus]|nr:hypothetical protein C1646_759825 [Rhizophagus diaphanus] [Rhizophagus sp. MUCL 43196]
MLSAQKKKSLRPDPKTINEATRLFSGLADLDYEPGHIDHIYFQYLSNNKNNISLLGVYHPEEIYSKYIVQVVEKGFTVIDHPSEVYGLPDSHEYAFALASSFNANKCSWHIVYPYACFIDYRDLESFVKKVADRVGKLYSVFINFDLYKSRFSLHLLGLAKKDRKPEKEEFQPIEDKTALSVEAGLVILKYGWLKVGDIRKGFINFQARSLEACPICNIKHKKDQLYGFLRSNGYFVLKCYRQKNYKPDHKGLAFGKVTEISAKPKRGIVERIGDAISNPRLLVGLSEMMINVEKLKDVPEVYPNFLGIEKTITLIRSPLRTWKTTTLREIIMTLKNKVHDPSSLPYYIWVSY